MSQLNSKNKKNTIKYNKVQKKIKLFKQNIYILNNCFVAKNKTKINYYTTTTTRIIFEFFFFLLKITKKKIKLFLTNKNFILNEINKNKKKRKIKIKI